MADILFTPSSQPALDAIFSSFNINRPDVITKRLVGSVAINADELFTNVNPLIFYISLGLAFYNVEGATRILNFYNTAGNIIYNQVGVLNVTSVYMPQTYCMYFNYMAANAVLANAATSLYFQGYRINLV